jgi:hypothetical protein
MPAVTSIGASAFYFCTALTTLDIPTTLLSVASQAFGDCFNLTSLTGGSAACPVVNGALMSGTTLMLVPALFSGTFTFPSTTTAIDSYAFASCSGITAISSFPAGLTSIGAYAFGQLSSSISMTLPSTVTSISAYAFIYSHITSVTIPASVSAINSSAFYGCTNLTSVTMLASSPPTLSGGSNFPPGQTIHVPSAGYAAYTADTSWNVYHIVTP